jgi:hypothetical protein
MQTNCDPQQTVQFTPPAATANLTDAGRNQTSAGGVDDSNAELYVGIVVCAAAFIGITIVLAFWMCFSKLSQARIRVVDVSVIQPHADIEAPGSQSRPQSIRNAAPTSTEYIPKVAEGKQHDKLAHHVLTSLPTPARAYSLRPP